MPRAATALLALTLGCAAKSSRAPAGGAFLFVWAGADSTSSDFLGVIDADTASPRYGTIVASVPTGMKSTHPHHTEQEMPANGHLLANGFHAGRTWLFDLSDPLHPTILTSFGDVGGFSYPHTYARLANGNVLATFQRSGEPSGMDGMSHDMAHQMPPGIHTTGGLVEMDEQGTLIRATSARDTTISDRRIYPYSVLPIPALDVAVSTTTDMDERDSAATSEWVQLWRLSDLALQRSIALAPGPRGNENRFTGEPRLLPDGKGVYIHTFNCGLYLLRDVNASRPSAALVTTFPGQNCGVPILAGNYWIEPVPSTHSVVSLDVRDPEHPRQVSSVSVGAEEEPHWLAIDSSGRRLVLDSGGNTHGNRIFIIDLDPATGTLKLDERFHDPGASGPGISLDGKAWPHGYRGRANPHGAVFSR